MEGKKKRIWKTKPRKSCWISQFQSDAVERVIKMGQGKQEMERKEKSRSNAEGERQHEVYRSTVVWHYCALMVPPYSIKNVKNNKGRWGHRGNGALGNGRIFPFLTWTAGEMVALAQDTNIINTKQARSYHLPRPWPNRISGQEHYYT